MVSLSSLGSFKKLQQLGSIVEQADFIRPNVSEEVMDSEERREGLHRSSILKQLLVEAVLVFSMALGIVDSSESEDAVAMSTSRK